MNKKDTPSPASRRPATARDSMSSVNINKIADDILKSPSPNIQKTPRRNIASLLDLTAKPTAVPPLPTIAGQAFSDMDLNISTSDANVLRSEAQSNSFTEALHKRATGFSNLQFRNEVHRLMYRYVESKSLHYFMFFIVSVHSGLLCFLTFYTADVRTGWYYYIAEFALLGVYMSEAILKIFVYRQRYFKIGWNVLAKQHIIIYLMLYIVVEYFVFLNLLVAVLVDNFQLAIEERNTAMERKKIEVTIGNRIEEQRSESLESSSIAPGLHRQTYGGSIESMRQNIDYTVKLQTISDYYPGVSSRALHDLRHYFLLLAAIEYNYYELAKEERLLGMMVNLTADFSGDF